MIGFGGNRVKTFLNTIRCNEKSISIRRQAIDTLGVLALGIALGTFAKWAK